MLNLHFGKPKKIHYYPKSVNKTGTAYDTVNLNMIYDNGVDVQILNSYASPLVSEISILTDNSWITFRKNEFIIYHPRDTFDKKGFFKDPPIYKKFKINNDEDYLKLNYQELKKELNKTPKVIRTIKPGKFDICVEFGSHGA